MRFIFTLIILLSAISSQALEVTTSQQNTIVPSNSNTYQKMNTKLLSSLMEQNKKILACNAKQAFYAPTNGSADSDGCVGITFPSTPSIEYAKTWRDYTGSRACNQTYQNENDYPIEIQVSIGGHGTGANMVVGGNSVRIMSGYSGHTNQSGSITIPPKTSYNLSCGNVYYIVTWSELR